ncbi:MAG: methyltransferase domain-containing protein [Bacteroidetes bacterium]|nr:methyltransferase domain-containing protein [Bacteroidota bacterium]
MNSPHNADELYAMANAFRQSRILLTAVELDVFSLLGEAGRSSAEIAEILGTDPRATDRLLNALCAIGLLEKEGGRFLHTDLSSRCLDRNADAYLGNLGHVNHLWDLWSGLTAAVRRGHGPAREPIGGRGDDWREAFIAAMHHRARTQAPLDVNLIDLHDAERILDLGGGSGIYAITMLRVKQDLRATVFDLPDVIPITRRYIAQAGLEDRIETRAGDYHMDDFGGPYDVVFLSAIIHSNSAEENRTLIRKCADALRPGGQLIVQDFIMEEDRTRPAHGALFALNMLVATEAGDTYTAEEVQLWMEGADLSAVEHRETQTGTVQVVGWKKKS